MSTHFSDSMPGPGMDDKRQPGEVQVEQPFIHGDMQVDPQQSFREYASPGHWNSPGAYSAANAQPAPFGPGVSSATPQPWYPAAGQYQPTYPGHMGAPWSSVLPGPASPYPGNGSPVYGVYPGYNYYAYPGYGYYPWPPIPAQPRRDSYLLGVSITAFICSCLAMLGGLISLAFAALSILGQPLSRTPLSGRVLFAGVLLFVTFTLAGLGGGGFCLYHSIRSLFFRKSSRTIWLPSFWIFLLCYLALLGIGFWVHIQGLDISSPPLMAILIYLGAIFPALTIMALGVRCLSFPRSVFFGRSSQKVPRPLSWPTSWRRLTLAMVSGATLGIVLAGILELIVELILIGSQSNFLFQNINDPNFNPAPSLYGVLLISLAVVAPLVEEMVKPLAVVILIGRVRSKAEAFVLGLACGIGFNLVETTGYISQGYNQWLNVILTRSGAGLLHGFGTAMVALGWYILTHREEGSGVRRTLLALGCAGYAILQHAIWNGTIGLALLPGPIGRFFSTWAWNVGPFSVAGVELVNMVEAVGILIFFVSLATRLRPRQSLTSLSQPERQPIPSHSVPQL